jgi:hypothetical protein
MKSGFITSPKRPNNSFNNRSTSNETKTIGKSYGLGYWDIDGKFSLKGKTINGIYYV